MKKIITFLLCAALLFSCVSIVAAANTTQESTAKTASEASASYGTIPEELDAQTYPWAIFSEGNFLTALKFYSNDKETSVLGWLKENNGDYVGKEMQILLRTDYKVRGLESDPADQKDYAHGSLWITLNYGKLTFDLGGHTFDNNNQFPFVRLYFDGKSSIVSADAKLDISVINGTLKQNAHNYGVLFYVGGANNGTPGSHRGVNLYASNITFDTQVKTPETHSDANIGFFASAVKNFSNYPFNVTFDNCKMSIENGGAATPTWRISNCQDASGVYVNFNTSCIHHDDNSDYLCDFCGEIFGDFIKPSSTFVCDKDGFGIEFLTNLPKAAKSVEITTAEGIQTIAIDENLKPDANGIYKFCAKVTSATEEVSFKVLSEAGIPLKMELLGELSDVYTTNVFDSIDKTINNGDADLEASVNQLTAELQTQIKALNDAIENKVSVDQLTLVQTTLTNSLATKFAIADDIIKTDLGKANGAIAELAKALEDAEKTLNKSIDAVKKELKDATDALNASIATKADAATVANDLKNLTAAYAAADLVLEDADEALAEADAAMAAAIKALQGDVAAQDERINAAETANTIQLVIIIFAGVVAVAALVLPFVMGKKKENA